jgi:hypothetical protein
MVLSSGTSERAAVVFFQQGKIVRQLRYSEFEAVLDHVGTLGEFACTTARAVFLDINGALQIVSAVFFQLEVDAEGHPDPTWNIPLQLLATQAERGPDLGGGPIRLATRSRCPIAWHQQQLWDPPLTGEVNPFDGLVAMARENRLGLEECAVSSPAATKAIQRDSIPLLHDGSKASRVALGRNERVRLARRLRAQRKKAAQQRADFAEQLGQVHGRHRQQLKQLEREVSALQHKLGDEHRVSSQLKQTMDAQAEHFTKMRKLISSQISQVDSGTNIGKQLDEEFNARLDAATAELQEDLERKDVEIFYRDGEIKSLGEKLNEIARHNRWLEAKVSGSDIIQQMSEAGIHYVASQPGAGEFQVPQEDLTGYLKSPQEYAARYCHVDIDAYRAWLAHNTSPRCNDTAENGKLCGLPVHRCGSPATFEPGESDRCSQHKASSSTLRQVMRARG